MRNTAQEISQIPDGFIPFPNQDGFILSIAPIYFRPAGPDVEPAMGFVVLEKHLNPVGICHGGMMMTLMDMACGQAVLHNVGRRVFPPSIQLNADFLQPARLGEWLESRFDFVKTTPRTGFANGYLVGPNGPVIRVNGICKLPRDDDARFRRSGGDIF